MPISIRQLAYGTVSLLASLPAALSLNTDCSLTMKSEDCPFNTSRYKILMESMRYKLGAKSLKDGDREDLTKDAIIVLFLLFRFELIFF